MSYGCSKSEDCEILSPLPKIRGVTKKQHSVNIEFWVPKRISARDNPIGYSFYLFGKSLSVPDSGSMYIPVLDAMLVVHLPQGDERVKVSSSCDEM